VKVGVREEGHEEGRIKRAPKGVENESMNEKELGKGRRWKTEVEEREEMEDDGAEKEKEEKVERRWRRRRR